MAPQLFRYQAFICRQSQHFRPSAWTQYDQHFRLKKAAHRSISWATVDTELVATWLSADATKLKKGCFSCGEASHMAADCPFRLSQQGCCTVCRDRGHNARSCPHLSHQPTSFAPGPSNSVPNPQAGPPRPPLPPVSAEVCRNYNRCGSPTALTNIPVHIAGAPMLKRIVPCKRTDRASPRDSLDSDSLYLPLLVYSLPLLSLVDTVCTFCMLVCTIDGALFQLSLLVLTFVKHGLYFYHC